MDDNFLTPFGDNLKWQLLVRGQNAKWHGLDIQKMEDNDA